MSIHYSAKQDNLVASKSFGGMRCKGTALITALFIMVLTVSLAVGMWFRVRIDSDRVATILAGDQLYLASTYVQAWAISQLQLTLREMTEDQDYYDDLTQRWAAPMDPIYFDGMEVYGDIIDMQGRFDINNLAGINQVDIGEVPEAAFNEDRLEGADEAMEQVMIRLLENVSVDPAISFDEASIMTRSIRDRLNAGTAGLNHVMIPFTSISELRNIAGMTPMRLQALSPYITALPRTVLDIMTSASAGLNLINVNTAEPEVLASALNSSLDEAVSLTQQRPFVSLDDFLSVITEMNIIVDQNTLSSIFDVNSRYFLVRANVQTSTRNITVFTLLHRSIDMDTVNVVWQSRGTF